MKAPPFPAVRAVSPALLPDHQATPEPEPNACAAPGTGTISVCEGNANMPLAM